MALLLPIEKIIFLHVPKTGGLFVENFLRSVTEVHTIGNRHSHMRMIGRYAYEDYFKFCFLRRPSDWYKSYWQMKMMVTPLDGCNGHWFALGTGVDLGGVHHLHHPTWDIDPYCGRDNLNGFVTNCMTLGGFLNRLYDSFVGWGGAMCNYVGRFDHLIENFEEVLDFKGIGYSKKQLEEMPKYNQSVERDRLSADLERYVNEVEDFYFNQKFGFQ